MADNKTGTTNNSNSPNQTIKAEQAKAEMGGQRHEDKAKTDEQRREPSAIGGGQSSSQSHTGEQGRARDELSQSQSQKEPAGR